jgi:hypothetical protein
MSFQTLIKVYKTIKKKDSCWKNSKLLKIIRKDMEKNIFNV